MYLENLKQAEPVVDPASEWFGNARGYAEHIFVFYRCDRCKEVMYGGHRQCGAGGADAGADAGAEADAVPAAMGEEGALPGMPEEALGRLCSTCKTSKTAVDGCVYVSTNISYFFSPSHPLFLTPLFSSLA